MVSWTAATVLAVAAWLVASLYLWLVRRRENETNAGLRALAGLHWRDFSCMVQRAMREQRDLREVVVEENARREPQSDFVMARGDARWLLSCKHGRTYRIGLAAVNELGAAARLTGARGGILITEGRVQRDGIAAAGKQSVEILDGPRIWPLLKPYLPSELEDGVVGASRRQARRHLAIAALGAMALGLLLGARGRSLPPPFAEPVVAAPAAMAAPTAAGVSAAATQAQATPPPTAAPSATAAPRQDPATDALPTDAATEQLQRQAVSKALTRTPGVIRGIWQTRMTLAIDRSGDDAQVWPRICQQVERYPALRTARIQLNPRPGRNEAVRWRQCRTL